MSASSCTLSGLAMYAPFLSFRFSILTIAQLIPGDPFLDPQHFLMAVCAFQGARVSGSGSPSSITRPFLTDDVLKAIKTAYSKSRTTEPYKVHRVLLNKLDDLTTDLRTSSGPININPTDIDQFIHFAENKAVKDGVPCLKYLWSGRAEIIAMKRKDWLWSDEEEDNARDREGREKSDKTDELSAGDENDPVRAWSGKRVQRKIESWAGCVLYLALGSACVITCARLSRQMRRSIDTGLRSHRSGIVSDSLSGRQDGPLVPHVIVSRCCPSRLVVSCMIEIFYRDGEDEEILSSGQVSPTRKPSSFLSKYLSMTICSAISAQPPRLRPVRCRYFHFKFF
jgi:hypothetical protein